MTDINIITEVVCIYKQKACSEVSPQQAIMYSRFSVERKENFAFYFYKIRVVLIFYSVDKQQLYKSYYFILNIF